jgi:6-pyruvoyltetrahydropterin/6-carboxytetrahydropterin synthase
MTLSVEGRFEAAHFLPNHPGKCSNLHGHNWRVELHLKDWLDLETGMICDFAYAKAILTKILEPYDHITLNDKIPNPTAENIALQLMHDICQRESSVYWMCSAITVHENDQCRITLLKSDYIDHLRRKEDDQIKEAIRNNQRGDLNSGVGR